MRKIYLLGIITFYIAIAGAANQPVRQFHFPKNISSSDYVHGKIIFKIKPEFKSACIKNSVAIPSLNQLMSVLMVESIEKKFPDHQAPFSERTYSGQKLVDLSLIYELNFLSNLPIEKAINLLLQDAAVEYAEPFYLPQVTYVPNDTGVAREYQLTKIHAFQGWDISKGDTNIVIGITDTGNDTDHVDLVNQVKYNYADPINGIDDDNDGYIDNFMGWDLGDNDNNPTCANSAVHGSFTAGCSSAQPDNISGVAGSGFNCKFLPVKISSGGYLTKAYEGIVYAADHGCQVINCSWGSYGGGQYGQDIINYATINKNCLVVAGTGNNNNADPFFPASYDYVVSVAATDSNDTRWGASSYGSHIDLTAPGEAVYSTIYDNNWSFSSGTSFSSPIVAGCAAIVKSFFPSFTPLQVAEQLRATSDDIDAIAGNVPFAHQLGKGRVNLYRALSENAKSVRMNNIVLTDSNDQSFAANDTLTISGEFVNYLDPVSNLTVTLTSNSSDVTILNGLFSAGNMATLGDTNNNNNPFSVSISSTIPYNTQVIFTLTFTDGAGYSDFQCFDILLNPDYINIRVNDVGTSITSKGRIGYNSPNQSQGIGFTYKNGSSLLFEGSLLAGVSESRVSDYLFGSPVSQNVHDFVPVDYVRLLLPAVASDFDLYSTFNDDSANANKLNVLITQQTFAWSDSADAKYILVLYTLKNNGASVLDPLYAGIYCDWDINNASFNRASVDQPLKLAYQWDTQAGGVYTGIKLLGNALFNCYEFDNNGSNGSYSIYDGFTKAEKYLSMSNVRTAAGINGQGNDVSMMVASGPYSLNAGDSIQVGFALLAGDSLAGLLASADSANVKFNLLTGIPSIASFEFSVSQNFPNPFYEQTTLSMVIPVATNLNVTVYDMSGKKIMTVVEEKVQRGKYQYRIDGNRLAGGLYFASVQTDAQLVIRKLIHIK